MHSRIGKVFVQNLKHIRNEANFQGVEAFGVYHTEHTKWVVATIYRVQGIVPRTLSLLFQFIGPSSRHKLLDIGYADSITLQICAGRVGRGDIACAA